MDEELQDYNVFNLFYGLNHFKEIGGLYNIYYDITVRSLSRQGSFIRAHVHNEDSIKLSVYPPSSHFTYLWSNGDSSSYTFVSADSNTYYLNQSSFCNTNYLDSILITPQNSKANCIYCDTAKYKTIEKNYPISIDLYNSEIFIDVDEDNINDFVIDNCSWSSGVGAYFFSMDTIKSLNSLFSICTINNWVYPLDSNEIISNLANWNDKCSVIYFFREEGDPYSQEGGHNWNGTKYLAFKFTGNNSERLGWIKIENWYITEIALQKESDNYINEIGNSQINIYPNPTKKYLNIELKDNVLFSDYNAEIQSISGEIVQTMKLKNQQPKINIQHLKAGVYVLILKNQESYYHKKFIVIH